MRRPPGGANLGAPNSDPYQLIAGAFGPRRAPMREQGGRRVLAPRPGPAQPPKVPAQPPKVMSTRRARSAVVPGAAPAAAAVTVPPARSPARRAAATASARCCESA